MMAWLRLDSAFAPVEPTHRAAVPCSMRRSTRSTVSTSNSWSPTTHIWFRASSRMTSFRRPFRRSYTFPP